MSRTSCALVCVLGAALLACALAAPHRQFVAEKLNAGVASYYSQKNTKHLCLREKAQINCRYVGCPDVNFCGQNGGCDDCATHWIGMSELACCDKSDYGYYGNEYYEGGNDDSVSFEYAANVGTCTWDADVYTEGIELENGAVKLGTAWATCYLNGGAEKCGQPFCDSMVLSFQGGAYAMEAYVKGDPYDREPTHDDAAPYGCFGYNVTDLLEQFPDINLPLDDSPGRKANNKALPRAKQSAMARALAKTSLVKRMSRHHKKGAASVRHSNTNTEEVDWTVGIAFVFSGQVEITSLGQRVDYTRGMMEYVPFYADYASGYEPPGSTATILEPYTYHLALVKNGASYE